MPDVKWEDVGGLEDVKKSILDTVQVKKALLCLGSERIIKSRKRLFHSLYIYIGEYS